MVDGTVDEISIRDVFAGTHQVQGIRGESHAQDYAVLRVLLAIFWRAHHKDVAVKAREVFSADDWLLDTLAAAAAGSADEAVLDYLDQHAGRFDLLHPEAPFMQVADLRTAKDTTFPVSRIIPEAEGDYFTMRSAEGREALSFAEAARWLIYTQAYDYSGIKSGAVGDDRVKGGRGYPIGTGWTGMTGGTTVVGKTLRETLVLNTTVDALAPESDLPVWERQPDTAAEREVAVPRGAADLATWQSRRIRLFFDEKRVHAVLVSNGDRIPDAGANVFGDPMTPYRYSSNKSKKNNLVYYPRPYETNRTMWRSLEPLIAMEDDPGYTEKNIAPKRPTTLTQIADLSENSEEAPEWANIQLVSVEYGPQSSSVATVVHSGIEIPLELLHHDAGLQRRSLLNNAKATSDASIALGSFAGMLLVAAGGEYQFQPMPTDTLLARLEPQFIAWLGELEIKELDRHTEHWQQFVHKEILGDATVLMRGAGPKALVGREIPQPGDSGGVQITSAGTAYRWLQRKLDQVLPLNTPKKS